MAQNKKLIAVIDKILLTSLKDTLKAYPLQNTSHINRLISKLSSDDINEVIDHARRHTEDYDERIPKYEKLKENNNIERLEKYKLSLNAGIQEHTETLKKSENLSPKDELIKYMQIAQRIKLIAVIDEMLKQNPAQKTQ